MAGKRRKRRLFKFLRHMQKKLLVMFGIVALMLIGLIARLMYIESTSGERYEKIILSQQQYGSQTIPYQRGDITDARGTVLATSVAVYNVILDCSVMTGKEDYIDATIQALVSCFPEFNRDELYGYAREKADSKYIVLKKRASYEEIQPYVEMQEAKDEKGNKVNPDLKGVWFEKEYQREYPHKSLASPVVGFTASGNVGVNGLENYYSDILNGVNGREYGYLNNDNNFEKTIKPAVNGNNIVSTIDANIQKVVENKIAEFNEAYRGNFRGADPGATHIGVLIMNPNNGDVIAMADYPDYDLSNPRDLSAYYTEEQLAVMSEEEQMDVLNKLWQNFCLTYTYEPGSTAKPFTVAAALESGKITGEEGYECDGSEMFNGKKVNCVSTAGHGWQTLQQAMMNSCNDALMQISYKLGADTFTRYQQIFGFGQRTNIDLPGEARTSSLIHQKENMSALDLATNAFGQNFNTTMIQLASAYCSLVNGGYLYQPHMVKKITDEHGNTIEDITPTLLRQTISPETCEALKQYMYATVSEGTGSTAKVDGYSMGGKTGTAQKIAEDGTRDKSNYLVSFIGFAPVEEPQLVIYCVVDEPNVPEQFHSTYAQDIVREILEEVLPYMNVYRDEETTGIHAGWDIRGQEVGMAAVTDMVNEDEPDGIPVEDGLTDIPNTMDGMEGGEPEGAGSAGEGTGEEESGAPGEPQGGEGGAPPGEGGEPQGGEGGQT